MIRVERAEFDPESGFLYYVIFKPNLEIGVEDLHSRITVEVAVSVTETGEVADLTFAVPHQLRNSQALFYICGEGQGSYVEPHVFVVVPGASGDTVVSAHGRLDVDVVGRIIGLQLQWQPTSAASA